MVRGFWSKPRTVPLLTKVDGRSICRICGKGVMFLHVSVILFTGGRGCMSGRFPPWTETPHTDREPRPGQKPSPQTETPPWTETPRTESPGRDPQTETPLPWTETPQTETPSWTETPRTETPRIETLLTETPLGRDPQTETPPGQRPLLDRDPTTFL